MDYTPTAGGRSLNRVLLSVFAIFTLILALFYFYGIPATKLVIMAPSPVASIEATTVPYVPTQPCRAVCVKDKKGELMEAKEIEFVKSIPLPECRLSQPNGDKTAYEEWSAVGLCSTICIKDTNGTLTSTAETDPKLPYCSILAAYDAGENINRDDIVFSNEKQFWINAENMAERCNDIHSLDQTYIRTLDKTSVHIVYFIWLPENKNARAIIPPQLQAMKRSGLLDRPNTFLHFAVSCDVEDEWEWFSGLPLVKKYAKTMVRSKKNRYEFTGIRLLWELSCRSLSEGHPNDIFLYFHAKGTQSNEGRLPVELLLTNEIVANWRQILNLMAVWPGSTTFGLGGSIQWINFFWTRASIAKTTPLPVITHSRFWYGDWASFDLRKEFPSATDTSQCHLASGIDSIAEIADSAVEPKDVKEIPNDSATRTIDNFAPEHLRPQLRDPQYSILRCGMVEVSRQAVTSWLDAAEPRLRQYLKDLRAWVGDPGFLAQFFGLEA